MEGVVCLREQARRAREATKLIDEISHIMMTATSGTPVIKSNGGEWVVAGWPSIVWTTKP